MYAESSWGSVMISGPGMPGLFAPPLGAAGATGSPLPAAGVPRPGVGGSGRAARPAMAVLVPLGSLVRLASGRWATAPLPAAAGLARAAAALQSQTSNVPSPRQRRRPALRISPQSQLHTSPAIQASARGGETEEQPAEVARTAISARTMNVE